MQHTFLTQDQEHCLCSRTCASTLQFTRWSLIIEEKSVTSLLYPAVLSIQQTSHSSCVLTMITPISSLNPHNPISLLLLLSSLPLPSSSHSTPIYSSSFLRLVHIERDKRERIKKGRGGRVKGRNVRHVQSSLVIARGETLIRSISTSDREG